MCEQGMQVKKDIWIGRKIQITHCIGFGKIFGNATDGSIHEVIEPPGLYKNDHTGVWIMGVKEKICILTNEFNFV